MPAPTIATIRALAAERGYAVEKSLQGARLKLVDLTIGHRLRGSFSIREAHRFLRQSAPAETRHLEEDPRD